MLPWSSFITPINNHNIVAELIFEMIKTQSTILGVNTLLVYWYDQLATGNHTQK